MCPFCYIGKRNFETALEQFEDKNHIEVIWKSYQLDPSIPQVASESYQDYLIKNNLVTQAEIAEMTLVAEDEVQDAVEFAESSPEPAAEDLFKHVFVEE